MLRGLGVPIRRLHAVFRDPVSAVIHDSKIELSGSITSLRRFGIPFGGFAGIGWNSITVLILNGEFELLLRFLPVAGGTQQKDEDEVAHGRDSNPPGNPCQWRHSKHKRPIGITLWSRMPALMKDRVVLPGRLPLLLVLFIGSGCSALIYEVVWSQLLELVIGASAISLGVLLGTFMGGMCLDSLLFPRLVSAERHPLRVYALLESGTAAFGLLILAGIPYIGDL